MDSLLFHGRYWKAPKAASCCAGHGFTFIYRQDQSGFEWKGAGVTVKGLPTDNLIYEITRQWHAERPDLDLRNFLLQIYLQRIGRIIESRFGKMCLRRFGVRAQDMRLLFALRRGGAPFAKRPTDLFKATLVTSGAITKQVDRLAKKKLVRRSLDPDYGGGFLIQLTYKGLEIIDRASTIVATESFIGPAMAAMTRTERAAAERFCLHLIATLEAADTEPKGDSVPRAVATKRGRTAPRRRAGA